MGEFGTRTDELAMRPVLVPLGDRAMLVRFGDSLSEPANQAALAFAALVRQRPITGVLEVVSSLVSVLLHYDPAAIGFDRLAGEIGLLMTIKGPVVLPEAAMVDIAIRFGGADGPDLESVAAAVGLSAGTFIAAHNEKSLRVLATGFAPGFVYCGFHDAALHLPRRQAVRPEVPVGSVLFAAGQTAIAATVLPTGWHVIGRTAFNNFDSHRQPPTQLRAGDIVRFSVAA